MSAKLIVEDKLAEFETIGELNLKLQTIKSRMLQLLGLGAVSCTLLVSREYIEIISSPISSELLRLMVVISSSYVLVKVASYNNYRKDHQKLLHTYPSELG